MVKIVRKKINNDKYFDMKGVQPKQMTRLHWGIMGNPNQWLPTPMQRAQ